LLSSKGEGTSEELLRVRDQQNRLLNLRMLEEIDSDTFAASKTKNPRNPLFELHSR
jgi:hypothetical protein